MTNYSVDTRVPLIISTPETRNKGIKCDALVELVDLYPTLCELAGVPVPSNLEGISMLTLFTDPGRHWKKATFSQFLREGIWSAPDGKEYMGRSIRTRKYLYVEWSEWKTGQKAAIELLVELDRGLYSIDLKKGEEIILHPAGSKPDLVIETNSVRGL